MAAFELKADGTEYVGVNKKVDVQRLRARGQIGDGTVRRLRIVSVVTAPARVIRTEAGTTRRVP